MKTKWSIALAAASVALGAHAQAIYRCGNSYGTQACAGAGTVAAAAPAKAAEVEASRRETEREMKVATAMEKARLAEEAKGPFAYIPKEKAVAAPAENETTILAKKKKPQKPKKAKKAA